MITTSDDLHTASSATSAPSAASSSQVETLTSENKVARTTGTSLTKAMCLHENRHGLRPSPATTRLPARREVHLPRPSTSIKVTYTARTTPTWRTQPTNEAISSTRYAVQRSCTSHAVQPCSGRHAAAMQCRELCSHAAAMQWPPCSSSCCSSSMHTDSCMPVHACRFIQSCSSSSMHACMQLENASCKLQVATC